MSNEKLAKLYKILENGTIGIPKEVMKMDGFDINTKIVFSVLLNDAINHNKDKMEFINSLNNVTLDFIFDNAVIKTENEAKIVQDELPILTESMFDLYT